MLDRIPIIVLGDNSDDVNNFLIELSELIHFRKEYVFYTDFISADEYEGLITNENIDYNYQRANIRCPCEVAIKALNTFKNIDSWLIGIVIPREKKDEAKLNEFINIKSTIILYISFFHNSFSVGLGHIDLKSLDLSLEESIFKKISQDTEKSIIKMKRVLNDKITSNQFDKDLVKTLLDFEVEKSELKKNIFKREIQNFFSGSKRAFFILSRLNLLDNMDIRTKIGSKTLLETIDYEDAPIERILSFIWKEWGEDFSNLIEDGKKSFMGNKIVSLWGQN
ncbi:MAG: hypothetical protein KJI71_00355 [Patescibacteria group bacterium]|nr:hypothetical protein [Patescibacteria group bacterium]